MSKENIAIDVAALVKSNPAGAAMFSKLVGTRKVMGQNVGEGINVAAVSSMAMDNARRQNDVRTALELFTDVRLAAQTLISLLLSPTDGVQTEFRYEIKIDIGLPAPATAEIMELVKEYLENEIDLRNKVHEIAHKAIIENGADPVLVLPESSLEYFLNNQGTLSIDGESENHIAGNNFIVGLNNELSKIVDLRTGIPKPMNVFTNPVEASGSLLKMAVESFNTNNNGYDPKVKVKLTGESENSNQNKEVELKLLMTDNVGVLRLPIVNDHLRERKAAEVIEKSRLGYTKYNDKEKDNSKIIQLSDDQIKSNFYRTPGAPNSTPFSILKDPDKIKRRTIGKPLLIHLPPESLMVIPTPNDSRKHAYYIGMIDMDGNFVKVDNYEDGFNLLSRTFSGYGESSDVTGSSLMQMASSRLNGDKQAINASELERSEMMKNIYQQLVEADIKARLRVGLGSNEIKISTSNEHIYEIMLARELSNRNTQLLLIPAKLVSYFAFNYDSNGVGRSLLDESRNILSVRTMLMVTEVLNSVRNSISRTNVDISFDARDRDPMSSFETIKSRILSTRGGQFPWGIFDIGSIAQQIQRAGVEFSFSGDNKLMPNTQIKFSESQSQHQKMDDTLREELRRLSLAGFSLTPELIDGSTNEELATAIKENKAQLARRVSVMSTEFNKTFKNLVKQLIKYNGDIYDRIEIIVIKNIKFIAKEIYRAKAFPKDVLNLIERDKKTKKLNKKNVWKFVKYVTDLLIDSIECTLPTHQRNSFKDRIDEIKDRTDALDTMLENMINSDALKPILKDQTDDAISSFVASVKTSVTREWYAEAGLDDVIIRYLEEPNKGLTNNAIKEISSYNQNLISLMMGHAKEGSELSMLVSVLMEKLHLGEEESDDSSSSDDSDSDSSSDDDSSDGDDSDGGGDDDDMFGDFDDMFGGTSTEDDDSEEGGDDDGGDDDSGSDDSSDDSESEDSSSDEA